MEQKEYWNSVSSTKNCTTTFQAEEFAKYVNKNAVILDVGCGYGRTLNELNLIGYTNLIGIDFSKGMIERGKNLFPNLDLRIKENENIDMLDNSVDVVILFGVLTCIASNEEQLQLMSEIKRVLKPNGIIYINDFLLNTDERNIERYKQFEEKYGIYGIFELPEGAILRHHSEEWVKKLVQDFEELTYGNVIFTTMNGHKSNGFYYFGKNNK